MTAVTHRSTRVPPYSTRAVRPHIASCTTPVYYTSYLALTVGLGTLLTHTHTVHTTWVRRVPQRVGRGSCTRLCAGVRQLSHHTAPHHLPMRHPATLPGAARRGRIGFRWAQAQPTTVDRRQACAGVGAVQALGMQQAVAPTGFSPHSHPPATSCRTSRSTRTLDTVRSVCFTTRSALVPLTMGD